MKKHPARQGKSGHVARFRFCGLHGKLDHLGNHLWSGFLPAHAIRYLLVLAVEWVIGGGRIGRDRIAVGMYRLIEIRFDRSRLNQDDLNVERLQLQPQRIADRFDGEFG